MRSPYNKSTCKKPVLDYDIDERKFWSFVLKLEEDECWPWQRALNTTGYGLFCVRSLPQDYERTGRSFTQLVAHRVAYALCNEDCDAADYICHKCDNTACCNPKHLWRGSQQDNVDDMVGKGRGFWQDTA